MDDLRDTAWGLRYQATESPARTVADCAVQAGVILGLADVWESSAIREAKLKADLVTVRRAAASIVAALAAVARLDIDRLGAVDLHVCCERETRRAPPGG